MQELGPNDRYASEVVYNWISDEECRGAWRSGACLGVFRPAERLVYHSPQGEGDRHYVDVTWPDGRVERLFNLNSVTFPDMPPAPVSTGA